jgi:hypothetical protein
MTSCLSKLKATPSFCFAFKIPDDVTASNIYIYIYIHDRQVCQMPDTRGSKDLDYDTLVTSSYCYNYMYVPLDSS